MLVSFTESFTGPYALKKVIEKQRCLVFDSRLERRLCSLTVNFKFGNGKCKMLRNGKHSHSRYLPKYLTVQRDVLMKKLMKIPKSNLIRLLLELHQESGKVAPSIYDSVSKILINKEPRKVGIEQYQAEDVCFFSSPAFFASSKRLRMSMKALFCLRKLQNKFSISYSALLR